MRSARLRILPVLTGLGLLGVLGGWSWWQGVPPAGRKISASPTNALSGGRTVHFEADARPRTDISSPTPVASARAEPGHAGPVLELAADEAAQFAALCELRLLAADTELDLSHREWAKLAAAVTHLQAVRLAYEAEIARTETIAPGRHRVEIPAYAEAGDELRRRFQAELHDALGAAVAAEVLAQLGSKFEAAFAGFGVSSQTLEITGDPARTPAEVTIERTARYWNSVDGRERVTTRRDVQFPAATDPGAEPWLPLLALLGKSE